MKLAGLLKYKLKNKNTMRKFTTYAVAIIINMAGTTIIGNLPDNRWGTLAFTIIVPLMCYCSGLFVGIRISNDAERNRNV